MIFVVKKQAHFFALKTALVFLYRYLVNDLPDCGLPNGTKLSTCIYYVKSPQSFCAACERIYCSERPAKAAQMFVHI